MTMNDQTSLVVNANDNYRLSWLDSNEARDLYQRLGSIGHYIIDVHVSDWWKNSRASYEYQIAHYRICKTLEAADVFKKHTFHYVVAEINVNPVSLINDGTLREMLESINIFDIHQ